MRIVAVSSAVLVLVFAVGCGGGGGAAPTPGAPGASGASGAPGDTTAPPPIAQPSGQGAGAGATCTDGAAASGPVISMEGVHSLNPSDETITAGQSVTWTNNSSTNHQIEFTGGPKCSFTLVGKSVQINFPTAGSYSYVCKIHPTFMKGTITVQ